MYRKSKDGKRGKVLIRSMAALALSGTIFFSNGMVTLAAGMEDVFDAQAYADQYPDLKAAFGDDEKALLNHYLTYGIQEGRESFGLLDVVKYREMYPDLAAAFGDDWDAYVEHYLTYGAFEGRETGTDFNALDYAERYPDLKAAFGDDVLALYRHYQTCGKTENREARSEKVVQEEIRQKQAQQAAAQNPSQGESIQKPEQDNSEDGSYYVDGYYEDGGWFRSFYDQEGRRIKIIKYDANGIETSRTLWEYGTNGKCVLYANYYGSDGIIVEYNENEDIISMTEYSGDVKKYESHYDYDENNKLISSTYTGNDGYCIITEYDENEWKRKETTYLSGNLIGEATFYPGEAGIVKESKTVDNDGYVWINKYDENGNLLRSEYYDNSDGSYIITDYMSDGSYIVTTYDANGQETNRTNYNADGTVK